ncbi:carboxypeptidase Y-deficient [Podochytrium sp. JEL0797]|nr:carboxypeptidase Y-deficient [Podochytrium sp. JEL0797]
MARRPPTFPLRTAPHRAFSVGDASAEGSLDGSPPIVNHHARARTEPPVVKSTGDLDTSSSSTPKPANPYDCPICGEPTRNLLHLNHHLDTAHSMTADPADDSDDPGKQILKWFKKTGESATRVLKETGENLGLKKGVSMDVLNQLALTSDQIAASSSAAARDGSNFDLNPNDISSNPALPIASNSNTFMADPESYVTRKHWQKDVLDGVMSCNQPGCVKVLVAGGVKMGKMVVGTGGVGEVRVHCRRCGKVFCDEHSALQMRLGREDARHDVEGVWCRVCGACFEEKEGYWDTNGVTHTRTASFLKFRSRLSDVMSLETNKLESRYEKLTKIYQDNPVAPVNKKKTLSRLTSSLSNSFSGATGTGGPNLKRKTRDILEWK